MARYDAEIQVAYQAGKAAKIAAAPTTSQTSLPSQNGPTVLMATRRSVSVRPTTEWMAPTPKSKPSSTKNPVQKTAMMMNHRSARFMGSSSSVRVGSGQYVSAGVLERVSCSASSSICSRSRRP